MFSFQNCGDVKLNRAQLSSVPGNSPPADLSSSALNKYKFRYLIKVDSEIGLASPSSELSLVLKIFGRNTQGLLLESIIITLISFKCYQESVFHFNWRI